VIQKKVCLLGAFGVGKTSLVRRFVQGIFDDRYLTTLGVKIDQKELVSGGQPMRLVLWDLAGEDFRAPVQLSYVRGASACLYVADLTRPETLVTARTISARVREQVGKVPSVMALNKTDLSQQRDAIPETVQALTQELKNDGWIITPTSAKTGDGVEQAFASLASQLL
jgi:small GTP-binding protein